MIDELQIGRVIRLPPPSRTGCESLEAILVRRRSVREFKGAQLTQRELAQLLWAAQGVTSGDGLRTAPSAGALYPLELYVANSTGLYEYDAVQHRLVHHDDRDIRRTLAKASWDQRSLFEAPVIFVITAVYPRTVKKYGRARGERYVQIEAGHAAQNLLLQAESLGLGGVPIGAFDDDQVSRVLRISPGESPLYLIPVGHPRESPNRAL
jgi:SagB-type dehydrogenase family enzyme